jgi:hypothetical protein
MKLKQILITAFCCILSAVSPAQARRHGSAPMIEELPRIPLDTIPTFDPETRIVLYANNTWAYYRPAMAVYDELPVYSENWDTTRIFSYPSVEAADLPERIDLALINAADEYHAPITGAVRSPFGVRGRRNHNGIDIPLRTGEPIYATFEGKVRYSKYNTGGYGNLVIVRHKNGLETWYAHLSRSNVAVNDYVKAGQVIGYGGNTGRSTGPHLHYEVRYCDQTFDPQFLIAFPGGGLKTEVFALERSYFNIHSRASEELIEDEIDDAMWDSELRLLAEMGDTVASRQLLANAVAREQEAERARAEAARAVYHTIVSGDMLGTISRKYSVSIDQICRLNSITRTTTLRLGRRLRIK